MQFAIPVRGQSSSVGEEILWLCFSSAADVPSKLQRPSIFASLVHPANDWNNDCSKQFPKGQSTPLQTQFWTLRISSGSSDPLDAAFAALDLQLVVPGSFRNLAIIGGESC
jgi:hypothetical protein